jgi:hypothetical protein
MRDLHNIAVTHRELSANTQASGRARSAPGAHQIQPWYHIRENQVVYGTILAAITGYIK